MKPEIIILTGGPAGWKSEALKYFLIEFPNQIDVIKEQATRLLESLPRPGHDFEMTPALLWSLQRSIFQDQLSAEEWWLAAAAKRRRRLVLTDRGLLDGAGYVEGGIKEFLERLSINQEEIFSRYAAVIHLESVAVADRQLWEELKSTNPARYETWEEAVQRDLAVREIWKSHPNWHLIAGTDVEYKRYRVREILSDYLFMEHERKWLLPKMPAIPLPKGSEIEQGYLFDDPAAEMRIRVKDGRPILGMKGEDPNDRVSRFQWEQPFFGKPFTAFWAMTEGKRVSKTRYEIPHGDFVIELDQFHGPHEGLVVIEIEANSAEMLSDISLPNWAEGAVDVTNDVRFSNRELAKSQAVPKHR